MSKSEQNSLQRIKDIKTKVSDLQKCYKTRAMESDHSIRLALVLTILDNLELLQIIEGENGRQNKK